MYKITTLILLVISTACSNIPTKTLISKTEVPEFLGKENKDKFTVADTATDEIQNYIIHQTIEKPKNEKINKIGKNKKKTLKDSVEKKITIETPKPKKDFDVPFVIGEELQYRVTGLGMNAAKLAFSISGYKYIGTKKVYYFKSIIKTTGLMNSLFLVNDLVESFTDVKEFYSHRYQIDGIEGKLSKNKVELYDSDKRIGILYKKETKDEQVSELKKEINIEPYSQDILSSFYKIRTLDFDSNNKQEFNVISGEKNKILKLNVLSSSSFINDEQLSNIECYKVELSFNDDKLKDNIVLWIEKHNTKRILSIEVPLKLGYMKVLLEN